MKEKIRLGHRWLPVDHFTHNNQPKTEGPDGGEYEREARGAGGTVRVDGCKKLK